MYETAASETRERWPPDRAEAGRDCSSETTPHEQEEACSWPYEPSPGKRSSINCSGDIVRSICTVALVDQSDAGLRGGHLAFGRFQLAEEQLNEGRLAVTILASTIRDFESMLNSAPGTALASSWYRKPSPLT